MKNLLWVLGALGVLLLAALFIKKPDRNSAAGAVENSNLDMALTQVASKINETLPMMVDKDTRLDTTYGGPGKNFSYIYTFPSYASTELDADTVGSEILPGIKKNVCGNKEMQDMLRSGVTAHYVYRGNDGIEIARLNVALSDCGISVSNINQGRDTKNSSLPSARKMSHPDEALLGHWRAGNYDLFFDRAVMWRLKSGQPPEKLNYEIVSIDRERSMVLLRMTVPTGGHWREVRFSPDKRTFQSRVWIDDGDMKLPSAEATYVGPEQNP